MENYYYYYYVLSFFKKGDIIQGGTLFKEIRYTFLLISLLDSKYSKPLFCGCKGFIYILTMEFDWNVVTLVCASMHPCMETLLQRKA